MKRSELFDKDGLIACTDAPVLVELVFFLGIYPSSILAHSAKCHQRMDVYVVLHVRAKSMKDGCHARSIARFGSDAFDGQPCYFHDERIDQTLIIACQTIKLMRQGEYGVNIRHFEQFAFEFIHPLFSFYALTYHTVRVATTVINVMFVTTVVAADDSTAECWCLANPDGTYEFDLLV
jgi:hypothetical protein